MLNEKQVVLATFILIWVMLLGCIFSNIKIIDIIYLLSVIFYMTLIILKKSNCTK